MRITIVTLFLLLIISTTSLADMWIDVFDEPGPVLGRYEPAWADVPVFKGQYFSPDTPGPQHSLITRLFTEGTIEVKTGLVKTIPAKGNPEFASSGLMIKSIGKDFIKLRLGANDRIAVVGVIKGKKFEPPAKPFKLEKGKSYKVKVALEKGRLAVMVNGNQYFDLDCPISAGPGKTGFYAESPVWYDNYFVTGIARPSIGQFPPPAIETTLARFRADMAEKHELLSTHGSIELYITNSGKGPARLEALELNGKPVEFQSQVSTVSWYEQRPLTIKPGESGVVVIRMRGLPEEVGTRILHDLSARPVLDVKATWEGAVSKSYKIPVSVQVEPVQINIMTFSNDLKRMWIYLQNNDWINNRSQTAKKIKKITVRGRDVTKLAILGEKKVGANIVPIVIDFKQPLPRLEDTPVIITFTDGSMTGQSLRAIPSRMILQVGVATNNIVERNQVTVGPRADWLEDIYNHCANTVNAVGKKYDHLPKAKQIGLWSGGLGSLVKDFGGWARPWEDPKNPEIVACWCDEVDKETIFQLFNCWTEMKQWREDIGLPAPLHFPNVMNIWSAGGQDFIEMMDGTMHEYGWPGGISGFFGGDDFGRFESLSWREYRRGRRPFYPYYRDGETHIAFDPETKMEDHFTRGNKRLISPAERRWFYYGNLLQGAKGAFEWFYCCILDGAGKGTDLTKLHVRIGLGGAAMGNIWDYRLKQSTLDMMNAIWDEIGRVYAEHQALGHLIAISDVTDRAKVTACTPALEANGKPAASASALICGLDAMIVVVLNHNFEVTRLNDANPSKFASTTATVDVTLPPWLKPVDVFRLKHDAMTDLKPEKIAKNTLRFTSAIDVNDLIVITGKPGMKQQIETTLKEMQERLEKARTSVPVHTREESYYDTFWKDLKDQY